MTTDTIEIDPEELSNDVREDLEDEIGEDLAEQKAKEIQINSMNNGEPNKKTSINTIREKLEDIYKFNLDTNKLHTTGTIENIEPIQNNQIEFTIKRSDMNKKDTIYLTKDSTELANLVEYKNVDKVSELQGKTISYRNEGYTRKREKYIIPKNLSNISKLRYKLFKKNLKLKNSIEVITRNDIYDRLAFGMIIMTLASLLVLPISTIPTIIFGTMTSLIFMMIIANIITEMLLDLLDGNFYEIKSETSNSTYF